ncbi:MULTISPECIES: hypothetical protein [Methanothrix]|jgi:hypothetical protein|uniref:Uncharacterized protein n=3 Tax=root TaxID=1 RepID=F4C053_METSG|nr:MULTISPECIES: hypothetical protein [Methanothrix]OPX77296.1 MAG: hypothetical protein A4E43_01237 [Methanosaeta sp. PtaB.Bin005]AEB67944.1 hypothetical protein MCON_1232 [Methanothrix soehngenii GP6]MBP7067699.1 hypothetical protein [Methanothrix sp.]MDD3551140.1 hypothetical protein [Methanothrix soehngenii]MDD4488740.1 hypothetical protein [Methanothrix soehngenii]
MYELNYDLWQEMIEDIAFEYAPLFSIMHEAARELPLSRALIDDLLRTRERKISTEPWQMWLQIDPIDDNIGGFRIYLMASEELDAIKELMSEIAEDHGISQEEINAFEVEHGLDMLGDVFEVIRDRYEILPEIRGGNIIFSLMAFDSQDIDDSKGNDIFWSGEAYTN